MSGTFEIKVEPCKVEHIIEMREVNAKHSLGFTLNPDASKHIDNPWTYSGFVEDKLMLIGGIVPYWKDRGEAWAIFRPGFPQYFSALHDIAKSVLDSCPFRRIEATIQWDFVKGHEWVRALGFELEAPRLKSYFPNGKDGSLYAMVKG